MSLSIYFFLPFKIIVNGSPNVNIIPINRINNPIGENISTPPRTCDASFVVM